MTDIEVRFLEEYKRAEALCQEYYGDGVSAYIARMEETPYEVGSRVSSWEEDFKTLKRLRWLRNRITHDEGISECNAGDLYDIRDFRSRLMTDRDPIAAAKRQSAPAKRTSSQSGGSHHSSPHHENGSHHSSPHHESGSHHSSPHHSSSHHSGSEYHESGSSRHDSGSSRHESGSGGKKSSSSKKERRRFVSDDDNSYAWLYKLLLIVVGIALFILLLRSKTCISVLQARGR